MLRIGLLQVVLVQPDQLFLTEARRRPIEMVQIEELILRVPGLSEEEAVSIGQEVASRVADGLPCECPEDPVEVEGRETCDP